MSLIGILIPTFNNNEYLLPCLNSLLTPMATEDLIHVYVVNNGEPDYMEGLQHDRLTILQQDHNLGWEGGLKAGLAASKEDFVVFMNDDTFVPLPSLRWANQLIAHFVDPRVGAVGPSTNVVMGAQQIFSPLSYSDDLLKVKFLIGFCMMVRRSALLEVGGIDDSLPGGDDFDLSIRLRKAGYHLLADRNVFIYHHGFKTGERVHGSALEGGWNSVEMTERTNFGLIRKHGLRPWLDCMRDQVIRDSNPYDSQKGWREDSEGDMVREFIRGEKVLELGCGARKTVPWAIGVDRVPKDHPIPGVAPNLFSQADITGDAQNDIPVEPNSFDTVVARHILEHLPDAVKAVQSWGRVLRHGGRLIIAVPNHQMRNTIPMNIEHVHAWTPDSLRHFMETQGWKTVDMLDPKNMVSLVGVFEKNGAISGT